MRASRRQVERIAKCLNKRLVIHERLGNRKNPYYEYSIVQDDDFGNYIYTELSNKSLKICYEYLWDLFDKTN